MCGCWKSRLSRCRCNLSTVDLFTLLGYLILFFRLFHLLICSLSSSVLFSTAVFRFFLCEVLQGSFIPPLRQPFFCLSAGGLSPNPIFFFGPLWLVRLGFFFSTSSFFFGCCVGDFCLFWVFPCPSCSFPLSSHSLFFPFHSIYHLICSPSLYIPSARAYITYSNHSP